jgi:hypothetical protein
MSEQKPKSVTVTEEEPPLVEKPPARKSLTEQSQVWGLPTAKPKTISKVFPVGEDYEVEITIKQLADADADAFFQMLKILDDKRVQKDAEEFNMPNGEVMVVHPGKYLGALYLMKMVIVSPTWPLDAWVKIGRTEGVGGHQMNEMLGWVMEEQHIFRGSVQEEIDERKNDGSGAA